MVTRLTCPGRGEVHQWSPCHNARRKLGLTGGARANPVCDHPGLATISNFSCLLLQSYRCEPAEVRNSIEVSLLLFVSTRGGHTDVRKNSTFFRSNLEGS